MVPAASAHVAPGLRAAAVDDVAGVEVVAEVDAWPRDLTPLAGTVTPVRVTVENHSAEPVLVSRAHFTLRGGSGRAYQALAPEDVAVANAEQPVTVVEPVFGPAGLAGTANARPVPAGPPPTPSLSRWETSFPYNSSYYFRGYTVTPEVRRTQALVRALPEGMVPAGGSVRGFVYFTGGAYGERRVLFEASLIKAPVVEGDGVVVAHARIPFRVR